MAKSVHRGDSLYNKSQFMSRNEAWHYFIKSFKAAIRLEDIKPKVRSEMSETMSGGHYEDQSRVEKVQRPAWLTIAMQMTPFKYSMLKSLFYKDMF